MTINIGRFREATAAGTDGPADTPAEEQKPAELVYGSAEEFRHERYH
ncbi:hypothetical protein [Arthrobacter sp. efr-133-TYG-120]|nr:hypothetical protein [Arthrobacter sp. efr-133-TYG-120]